MQTSELWKQACEIYIDMADMHPSDAMEKLRKMHALDPAVYQILQQMIENADMGTHDLKSPLWQHDNKACSVETSGLMNSGDHLDQYKLSDKIGEGGMASVFLAYRTDSEVQKPVAIKLFNKVRYSEVLLKHFQTEQAILSRLHHPHIISMHYGGVTESQLPFMVMDYVNNAAAIDEYVADNHLSTRDTLKLAHSIAEALAYAHANLVVHRDIKPSNLLVDAQGQVRVVDFGIAHSLDETEDAHLTTLFALTPGFAAPEQVINNQVSVQTDVFSLGAVLLTVLSAKQALPKDRLMKQCQTDEAYIAKLLKQLNVNQDLKNIINKSLQANPARRYLTMQAFSDDIKSWLSNEPVKATPDTLWYRLRKLAVRKPAAMASFVTLSISAVIGFSALLWQVKQTSLEAEKANQVKAFMLETYSVNDPDVRRGAEVSAYELLEKSLKQMDTTLELSVQAELLQSIGIAFGQLGNHPKAVQVLSKANDIEPENVKTQVALLKHLVAEKDMSEAEPLVALISQENNLTLMEQATLLQAKALIAVDKQTLALAEENILRSIRLWEQIGDVSGWARARNDFVMILDRQSKPKNALRVVEKTLEKIKGEIADDHSLVLSLKFSQGFLATVLGDFSKAKNILESLQVETGRILGKEHPQYGEILMTRVSVSRGLGLIEEAELLAEQAYQLFIQQYDKDHFNVGNVFQIKAVLAVMKSEYEVALNHFTEAARIYKLNFGPENSAYLSLQADVAVMLRRLGNLEQAKEKLEEIYTMRLNTVGENHRDTFVVQSKLGNVLAQMQVYDQAIALLMKSSNNSRALLGEKNPTFIDAHYSLGKTYHLAGKFEKALSIYMEIENRALIAPNNQENLKFLKSYAQLLFDLKRSEEALTYARAYADLSQQLYSHQIEQINRRKMFLLTSLVQAGEEYEADQLWDDLYAYFNQEQAADMLVKLAQIKETSFAFQ